MARAAGAVLYGRGRKEESELLVWLTVAVALLIGLGVELLAVGRTQTASAGPMRITYPTGWVTTREPGALFSAADLRRGGVAPPALSVRELPKDQVGTTVAGAQPTLAQVATTWSVQRGRTLTGYKVLDISPTTVIGREAVNVEYAYVTSGAALPGLSGAGAPALVRAVDTLVASGDGYAILTFSADSTDWDGVNSARFPRFRSLHDSILSGWQVP
jgi:hypothetical protein